MSRRSPVNLAASIRQRLQNRARERGEDFQRTLTQYAIERLLYRLGRSQYRLRFTLKGAMLYRVWGETAPRNTKDLDLLGTGDCSVAAITEVFRDLADELVGEPDGVTFDADSIQAEEIAEQAEYKGVRVRMSAQLDSARIKVQVDVGVGDAIFPTATRGRYPTILDLPAPEIPMYPRETVVAEKFHAITVLALGNSRLKDFYDLWFLAQHFRYEGPALAQAVKTTFDRRSAVIPTTLPLALTEEFWSDPARQAGWDAFLQRTEALGAGELRLEEAVRMARDFVIPATKEPVPGMWLPGGPWTER
jgi:predicted nucleotidyltransferase component of viral defense system